MTREKLQKTYVERLVMGPEDDFGPTVVQEELAADPTRVLWAVMIGEDNRIDVGQLLNHLEVEQPDQIAVGRVSRTLPTDLVNAKSWTRPTFMKFDQDVQEGVAHVVTNQGSYSYDFETNTEIFALDTPHMTWDLASHRCEQLGKVDTQLYSKDSDICLMTRALH